MCRGPRGGGGGGGEDRDADAVRRRRSSDARLPAARVQITRERERGGGGRERIKSSFGFVRRDFFPLLSCPRRRVGRALHDVFNTCKLRCSVVSDTLRHCRSIEFFLFSSFFFFFSPFL